MSSNKIKIVLFLFHLLASSSCMPLSTIKGGLNLTNDQGEKNGFWREVKDSKICLVQYSKGKKKGKEVVIFEDDSYARIKYKNGEPHGKKRFYRKDGVIYKIIWYKKGKVIKEESFSPRW